jgi:pyruvate-formate lyase-activating enzyme
MRVIKIPESYKYIAVFPTMRCNLNCSFCLNAFDKNFNRTGFKELTGKEWVEALNRLESSSVPISFSGGEPFLHPDFLYILNNLKQELNIDILTNLYNEALVNQFISQVKPERIKRDAPYASIRVSYHPEQMDAEKLIRNVKKLQDIGFSVGIWAVQFPSPQQLQAITQMQFRCKDAGIDFRVKDFTGQYKDELYGDYSKYPGCFSSNNLKTCLCKTSELLVGPDANIYRCHRDLFTEENPIGNLLNSDFQVEDKFRTCNKYGQCHPCDVKLKTNFKQQLGHTSVEIKDIKD